MVFYGFWREGYHEESEERQGVLEREGRKGRGRRRRHQKDRREEGTMPNANIVKQKVLNLNGATSHLKLAVELTLIVNIMFLWKGPKQRQMVESIREIPSKSWLRLKWHPIPKILHYF